MNSAEYSSSERRQLLDRFYTLRRNLSAPHHKAFTMAQSQMMVKERDAVLDEYAKRLPLVPLSRCPFCAEPLEYSIDVQGLDGPWWFNGPMAEFPQPKCCTHFRVLLGAMDFHSNRPLETELIPEVLPGPGVPFVVPRLLEIPTMKTVVSSFTIPPNYMAYAIAYFSENPLHGALLHQPWGRQAYQVLDENGKYEGWTAANDKIDFDLGPWIDKGLVLWVNPGDSTLTLQNRPPCPYVNLPGVRAPQKIVRGELETMPLPTGKRLQPFE